MPAEITLTNEQKVSVTATPVTAAGRPASVDGDVNFEVTSGDASIERIDSKSAYIISGDTLGDVLITVSADADIGAGVESIADSVLVHVQGAKATSLGLTLGTPEVK